MTASSSFPFATEPPPVPGANRPLGRALAWIAIVASIVIANVANWRESHRSAAVAATSAAVDPQTELVGRYLFGAEQFLLDSGQATGLNALFIKQFDDAAKTPIAKLAAVPLLAELQGKQAALDRLDSLRPQLSAPLDAVGEALRTIYTSGSRDLSPEQRSLLREHLGWFARLAENFGAASDVPDRAALIASARRTCVVFISLIAILPLLFIGGLVLLIVLLLRRADGRLVLHYSPTSGGGGLFLESFAIYLLGILAATLLAPHLPAFISKSLMAHIALMLLPTLLAIAWPLLHGVGPRNWRLGLGWHTGRGVFREVGMGIAGYIAGFPIVAVGFVITLVLIKLSGAMPTHPIQKMLNGPFQTTLLVYFLASIYAPLTEETMFRGAFFHSLRARHRWLVSALLSAFVFAAVHPQGWTVVPTLMAIAVVFAGIREWRGTILSSATAHCLHNTVLITVAIRMLG